MILGDLIRQYRKDTGTSMDTFAKKTGLSKAYVSILERNYNPVNGKAVVPSLETIKAVSTAVGLDFNEVIAALDDNQPVSLQPISNPAPPNFNDIGQAIADVFSSLPHNEQRLLDNYHRLSPPRKKQADDYVQYLAEKEDESNP